MARPTRDARALARPIGQASRRLRGRLAPYLYRGPPHLTHGKAQRAIPAPHQGCWPARGRPMRGITRPWRTASRQQRRRRRRAAADHSACAPAPGEGPVPRSGAHPRGPARSYRHPVSTGRVGIFAPSSGGPGSPEREQRETLPVIGIGRAPPALGWIPARTSSAANSPGCAAKPQPDPVEARWAHKRRLHAFTWPQHMARFSPRGLGHQRVINAAPRRQQTPLAKSLSARPAMALEGESSADTRMADDRHSCPRPLAPSR